MAEAFVLLVRADPRTGKATDAVLVNPRHVVYVEEARPHDKEKSALTPLARVNMCDGRWSIVVIGSAMEAARKLRGYE